MYPILKKNYMLLRQHGSSVVYPLLFGADGQELSSTYSYEKINKTASEILELCDGTRSEIMIAEHLAIKYGDSYDKIISFVENFLSQSVYRGIIEVSEQEKASNINISGSYDTIYPFNVQFELTKACQLRCLHCYNKSGQPRGVELKTDETKAVIDKLYEMGVKKIMLTGGEPTARQDLGEIAAYAASKFIGVSIASNGYGFTPSLIKRFRHLRNVVVQISIDGTESHHNLIRGRSDSYQRAVASIRNLVDNDVNVVVASTFNDINYQDMEAITKTVKDLGAKQITYSITINSGRAKENNLMNYLDPSDLLYQGNQMKKRYSDARFFVNINEISENGINKKITTCGRGDTQICIRENGDVSPCLQFEFVYGNLLKQEPYDIFHYTRVLKMRGHKEPNFEICNDCSQIYSCCGCAAMAYSLPREVCKWKRIYPSFVESLRDIEYTDKEI